MDRPRPPVVTPAPAGAPVPPPSDAIVLFSGPSLEGWQKEDGTPARWTLRDGYMEVARGAGSIRTTRTFGDVQLHVEYAVPHGRGEQGGNSGVYVMGMYEIQVLDSYGEQITYADGMNGAVYGQHPPLVNVSRPPMQWQTYDIVFHRPHFRADGSVETPGRVTVIQNGVLVQDNVELWGQTVHGARAHYEAHGDRGPLLLQDHGDPVRYRNIWVRPLE